MYKQFKSQRPLIYDILQLFQPHTFFLSLSNCGVNYSGVKRRQQAGEAADSVVSPSHTTGSLLLLMTGCPRRPLYFLEFKINVMDERMSSGTEVWWGPTTDSRFSGKTLKPAGDTNGRMIVKCVVVCLFVCICLCCVCKTRMWTLKPTNLTTDRGDIICSISVDDCWSSNWVECLHR